MIKFLKSLFSDCKVPDIPERPDPPPAPQPVGSMENSVGEDVIFTHPIVEKKFKKFVQDMYVGWVRHYVKEHHHELNHNRVLIEIADSVELYTEQTLESISSEMDSFFGWIESDVDDFAEGIFEPYDGSGIKSVRNPNPPQGAEEVWDSDDECAGCKDEQGEYNCETCVPETPKKTEVLRDWNNDW